MCRLFGMTAGDRRVAATFWLLDAPDSLEQQSHRNPDGCGVAGFRPDGEVELHKAPVAAWDDPDFGDAARRLESATFVGHVRHASTGARTYVNTHPFTAEGLAFAHNGGFGDLPQVDARLGDWGRLVQGDTDSERLFALILREAAAGGGDLAAAITAAVAWLADHVPVVSLNVVLISATELWALRYPETNELYVLAREAGGRSGDHHLHGTGQGGGLRVRSDDLRGAPAVVVASERIDEHPDWHLLASGELVHVTADLVLTRTKVLDQGPRDPG